MSIQPLALLTLAVSLGGTPAEPPPADSPLAAQVRAAEAAFAKTMADRDHAAFVGHLASDVVFMGGGRALRGREVVAATWKKFYEGESAPFAWAPSVVEVLDSGDLAFSSGPVFAPDGRQVDTFNSVWRKEADGRWRVVFDKGCECEAMGR